MSPTHHSRQARMPAPPFTRHPLRDLRSPVARFPDSLRTCSLVPCAPVRIPRRLAILYSTTRPTLLGGRNSIAGSSMFRKLGGIISFLAALICIGAVAGWVRSRHHADLLAVRTTGGHVAGAVLISGGLLLAHSDAPYEGEVTDASEERTISYFPLAPEKFKPFSDVLLDPPTAIRFSFLGFKTATGNAVVTSTLTLRFTVVVIPYWLLITISALVALAPLRKIWIRRRRIRKGLCLGCGYDVRASTGRCPECGREIAPAARQNAASAA